MKFAGDESNFGGFDALLGLTGAGAGPRSRLRSSLGYRGASEDGQGENEGLDHDEIGLKGGDSVKFRELEELVVSEGDVALLKGRPGFVDGKFRGRGDCRNNLRIKV